MSTKYSWIELPFLGVGWIAYTTFTAAFSIQFVLAGSYLYKMYSRDLDLKRIDAAVTRPRPKFLLPALIALSLEILICSIRVTQIPIRFAEILGYNIYISLLKNFVDAETWGYSMDIVLSFLHATVNISVWCIFLIFVSDWVYSWNLQTDQFNSKKLNTFMSVTNLFLVGAFSASLFGYFFSTAVFWNASIVASSMLFATCMSIVIGFALFFMVISSILSLRLFAQRKRRERQLQSNLASSEQVIPIPALNDELSNLRYYEMRDKAVELKERNERYLNITGIFTSLLGVVLFFKCLNYLMEVVLPREAYLSNWYIAYLFDFGPELILFGLLTYYNITRMIHIGDVYVPLYSTAAHLKGVEEKFNVSMEDRDTIIPPQSLQAY